MLKRKGKDLEEIVIKEKDIKEVNNQTTKDEVVVKKKRNLLSVTNAIIAIVIVGLIGTLIAVIINKPVSNPITSGNESNGNKELDVTTVASSDTRNVLYYGDWSIWGGQGNYYPKDIAASQITHLNFAFLDFDANGELVFTDHDAAIAAPVGETGVEWSSGKAGILNAFIALRAKNPNMKIGISVGGWSKSGDFSVVCADAKLRTKFVNNLVAYVKYTNLDFVDIDWEYPGMVRDPDTVDNDKDEGTKNSTKDDKANYISFLNELKNALNEQGKNLGKTYELSVALPAGQEKLEAGINIKELFKIVDFANVMTYDLRGAWDDTSGHQSNLYSNPNDSLKEKNFSVDKTVNYLLDNGAESKKIVIGSAFYTRGWNQVEKGSDPKLPGLFTKANKNSKDADQTPSFGGPNEAPLKAGDGGRASGVFAFGSLDKIKGLYPNIKEYWDDTAKAPYMYDEKSGAMFTYDNEKSIQAKADYVKEKKLGGMISWMASQDKVGENPGKRDVLISAQKVALLGKDELPKKDIIYTPVNLNAKITTTASESGGGSAISITITNDEKIKETNDVLKELEVMSKTVSYPKLYIKSTTPLTSGDYQAGTVSTKDGYTIVDLSAVYDAKTLAPGASYTFKINGADDKAITSIEIAQHLSSDGSEINRQVIYGDKKGTTVKSESNTNDIKDTDPKVDAEIKNETKDKDEETSSIGGKANSLYKALNLDKLFKRLSDDKSIQETPAIPSNNNEETKTEAVAGTYTAGQTAKEGGKTYKAKWWTQSKPGSDDSWEEVK